MNAMEASLRADMSAMEIRLTNRISSAELEVRERIARLEGVVIRGQQDEDAIATTGDD